ncbi:MAG TPA: DNA-processing protein DprA [Baekduia sp.]|jgi:DNA processing protein
MTAGGPCAPCLRRAALLRLVAGRIDVARKRRHPIRDVLALSDDDLLAAVGGDEAGELRRQLDELSLFDLLASASDGELEVVCRHGAGYPARLNDDNSAPAALFVRGGRGPRDGGLARLARLVGDARSDDQPAAVAIVGTRRASPEGLEIARALGQGLASVGVTVVSGMALGVDSAAHAGALEAGGPTVAVLAGGADVAYPRSKARLYDAIVASGGAIVSEMPPRFAAFKWNFPARNRIIAALAPVTIVIEAAERSGSLITAEFALELGRDVGAVPGPVTSWRSDGTNALLRDGATLIRHPRDVLDLIFGVEHAEQVARRAAAQSKPAPLDTPDELLALLSAIDDGRDTIDSLTPDAAGAAAVRAGLMELELRGLIRRTPGGRVLRTARAEW